MPTKKEVKKLSKEVVLAIDWAAAEYNYLVEFKQELKKVEEEQDISKELKELKRASKLLKYMSRAERRAYRFEEKVGKEIHEILKELEDENISMELISGFRIIVKQLGIEHDMLVKLASFYDSTLEAELDKAKAEAKLEEKLKKEHPQKAAQVHQVFLQLLHQIQQQIGDLEEWIRGLEVTLKKCKELLQKLDSKDQEYIMSEGMKILLNYKFDVKKFPQEANFMAKLPRDLYEIEENCQTKTTLFFSESLPIIIGAGFWNNPITWNDLLEIIRETKKETIIFFHHGMEILIRNKLVTTKTWPKIMTVIKTFFRSDAIHFFPLYEIVAMIPFVINCLRVITKRKITIVYAIDRSARILGVLLQRVLSDLGLSREVVVYFLNVKNDPAGRKGLLGHGRSTILYSIEQRNIINGKNILVIDDYRHTGDTISAAEEYLREKGAKVTSLEYAASPKFYASEGLIINVAPSWYGKKYYSGVIKTYFEIIEPDKSINRSEFVALRKAILEAADIIADFSKSIDYLN